MRIVPFAPLLSLLAAAAPANAQQPAASCRIELGQVDDSFGETQARLNRAGNASAAEKCAAVAHHIDVMSKAVDVYTRCLPPGHDRSENLAQLNASIADFRDIQAGLKCK